MAGASSGNIVCWTVPTQITDIWPESDGGVGWGGGSGSGSKPRTAEAEVLRVESIAPGEGEVGGEGDFT